MPPVDAFENRVLDQLMATTCLGGIGTPPTSWLTVPVVAEGLPREIVPSDVATTPRIYVQHDRTGPSIGENQTLTRHHARAEFSAWIAAKDRSTLLQVKADVLRAVYAAEGTIAGALGMYVEAREFIQRDDLVTAGFALGQQILTIDFDTDHASP